MIMRTQVLSREAKSCRPPLRRNVAANAQKHVSSMRPHVAVTPSRSAQRWTSPASLSVSSDCYVSKAHSIKSEKKPNKQIITVAVDGSENSAEGLKWLLDSFSGTGSTLNVVHVVNNERVSTLSLGSMSRDSVSFSFDEDFANQPHEGYVDRKVAAAEEMIKKMYLPHLEEAEIEYSVNVHVVDGQRSAAGIAEQVVQAASAANSNLLAVTSHGGGLHCSYGSVARYCTQHFSRAILLLPPGLDSFPHRASKTVCVGVNTLSELQDSMTWALRNFCRGGDSVSVLRAAEETMTGRAAGSDQTSIMLGLQEQIEKHHIDDICFDLIQPDFASASASMDPEEDNEGTLQNQVTADELLRVAETKGARCLVMTNYAAKGFMQEMMFGTLSLLASRKAPLPLLLIPPGHSFE